MTFLVLMLACFVIGMPVAVAMGLSALIHANSAGNLPLLVVPQRMILSLDSFPLLGIPYFILAGALMTKGGVTRRLVDMASALVGHITGGMAHANIVNSMVIAGMTGSGVADAAANCSVLYPTMVRAGYGKGFSAAIIGAAATVGPIIPPSIPFVILSSLSGISTGRLFLGGIVPGILMGIYLMVAAYIISKRRGFGRLAPFKWGILAHALRRSFLSLLTPVILLGGIMSGQFTPTEAAVMACVYAMFLGFYYRELTLGALREVVLDTAVMTGGLMLILAAASLAGWLASLEGYPQALVGFLRGFAQDPVTLLLLVNGILLFLGMLLDALPILILVLPVLMPLAIQYGIDPVHFGVVAVLTLMVGLLTPPVGMVMYTVCSLTGVSVRAFSREVLPFEIALLLVVVTITLIPETVTFIPNLAMGPGK